MPGQLALMAAALAAALAVPPPARAAEPGVARGLSRSAWYWQARGREDKAEEAWKQVLAADPDDLEALAALGGFDARAGRADEARRKLARLERLNPGHSEIPVLRRQLELGERYGSVLSSARRSVHEGRLDEGIARYRALFGDAGPPGDLALEYYETIGGTPGGWREAHDGLRKLVRRAPGEVRFELALGKLLTWRDETRREGVAILSRLARHPAVGKEATAGWRQALLWLGSAPEDVALRQEYLKRHPNDGEIARRLEADQRAATARAGFAALERGDLGAAERLFSEVEELPDARLGLALVAARRAAVAQERHQLAEARSLLERARKLAPARPDLWEQPLRAVRFQELLDQARADRRAGRTREAEAKLHEAIDGAPEADRWLAHLAIADLYRETGRLADAEARYRDVLTAVPDQPDALRALTGILVEARRYDEAAPLNERLARIDRGAAFSSGWLTAEEHRTRAARLRHDGDLPGATAELEAARRADPGHAWALHDLAGVLLEQGAAKEARRVLGELLRVAPDLPEGRVLEARLLVAEGEEARALEVLAALPPAAAKDPSVAALRRRLEVRVHIPEALRLAGAGDRAAAERALGALERKAGDDADLLAEVAAAWSRLGLAAQERQQFAEARAFLERSRQLAPGRPEVWEQPLRSVRYWELVEQARADRAGGRTRDAEAKLLDAIGAAPGADRWVAQLALADLYRASRRVREAEAGYRDVLAAVPDQPDALRALTGLLVEARRYDEAGPLNERLARIDRDHAFSPGWLRAEEHRTRAARLRHDGDLAGARAELEAARRADPENAWALHDLAGVLLEQGATKEARPVLGDLLRVAPDLPEGRVLEARLLVAEGEEARALEVLAGLPPAAAADPAIAALRRRLEVRLRIPEVLRLAGAGDRGAAERALVALERKAGDDPELGAQIAVAWSRLGAHGRALELMRAAIARAPEASRGARLEIAAALLEAGDDQGVVAMLDGLEREPSLSEHERRAVVDLRIAHAVRLADRRREQGDTGASLAALDPVLRDYPGDPRLLAALGRVHERLGDSRRAHEAYAEALARTPEDADVRRGVVDAALAEGKLEEARRVAEEGRRLHPGDPRAHLLAARVATRLGDDAAAMRALERALALSGAEVPPAAPERGTATPPEGGPRRAALDQPPAAPASAAVRGEIAREMERVRERHPATSGGELGARDRSGEPGLGELREYRQSVEAGAPIGFRGRVTFRASAVELDGGSLAQEASPRFGTGGLAQGAVRAVGGELRLAYAGRILAADIGTTPLGFPVWSMVGGGSLRHAFGSLTLAVEGGRRVVAESALSYAGVKDPATGVHWGGVVADGGRVEATWAPERARVWVHAGADRLVGFNVRENRRASAGGGLQARWRLGASGELLGGVAAAMLGYRENLSYFTYGHGGYFSPERFVHVGLPIVVRRGGRVFWELAAEPGYHWFRQAEAPVLPIGPPDGTPEDAATLGAGPLPASRTEGFAFDGRALLGVALPGRLDASLSLGFQDAPEFREVRGALLLRFAL